MTDYWVRLHVDFFDHPKASTLPASAIICYLKSLCWARKHLTDGRVPGAIVARFGRKRERELLIESGLWDGAADGIEIHDYLDWQESKADVEKRRSRARKGGLAKAARQRGDPPDMPAPSTAGSSASSMLEADSKHCESSAEKEKEKEIISRLPEALTGAAQAVDDDETTSRDPNDVAAVALDRLADLRVAAANGVRNPAAYRARTRAELDATHRAEALALAATGATPDAIAAQLHQPPPPPSSNPLDAAVKAQAARMTKPECTNTECTNTECCNGWVEDGASAHPCPTCNPRAVGTAWTPTADGARRLQTVATPADVIDGAAHVPGLPPHSPTDSLDRLTRTQRTPPTPQTPRTAHSR